MGAGWIRACAPATIANLGPGFDAFALAVRGPADEVAVRPATRDSLQVHGVEAAGIPSTFSGNTAGIAIEALRAATGISQALEVRVVKGIPPGRGLGSSAGSCAAAALAFLKAFPKSRDLGIAGVLRAAVEGEAAVSGRHFDNLAGALLGGFVVLGSSEPLLLTREPVSPGIALAIAIPDFVLRTADMRKILPPVVPLRDAVSNVGHAAILALALARGDAALAGRCLEDRFAEPVRAPFLDGYAEARSAALKAGATGFASLRLGVQRLRLRSEFGRRRVPRRGDVRRVPVARPRRDPPRDRGRQPRSERGPPPPIRAPVLGSARSRSALDFAEPSH